MIFDTSYEAILDKIDAVTPIKYGKTRNFVDGAVTYLSPYISRGVISTRQVLATTLAKGFKVYEIEKFAQELAWRDYWQQVWIAKGTSINQDLKREQPEVAHHEISRSLVEALTEIETVDRAIRDLQRDGYMHNHMRMYVASIACNVAGAHWHIPAKWLYYELLDGDWASNALSWQWVAGANANKKYYANQGNINKFFHADEYKTFLDVSYEELPEMSCPEVLQETFIPTLNTSLPQSDQLQLDLNVPTLLYNYYNLDPTWRKEEQVNRILLLEPSIFEAYPVSKKCIDFVLKLGENIPNLQVFVGEFEQLKMDYQLTDFIYKEHPLNQHYEGVQDERDWLSSITGYFPSFFGFWKKCKKELKKW